MYLLQSYFASRSLQQEINHRDKKIYNNLIYISDKAKLKIDTRNDGTMNDWKNNLNLLRTNKNGETELNIGSILSRTQKQSIILMPHFGKNDISNTIDIPVDILNESYLRLNEIIKSSNSLKIKLDILDRPYLYISFNDKGLNSRTSKLIKQLIVDQSKDQFNECPIDKNIQCIELLVDVKSSKDNKIDISFKYGEFDELIDNIFLKNEISNSNKHGNEKLYCTRYY